MENKVLSILLGGLIVAIIFHAVAFRYEMHQAKYHWIVYRIDRLTGRMRTCDMNGIIQCFGGKYSDQYPREK